MTRSSRMLLLAACTDDPTSPTSPDGRAAPPPDGRGYRALEFWIEGSGTANTINVEIEDADGELFDHSFVDDFTGWRFASVPLTTAGFPRRTDWQPVAVNNGLTLSNVKFLRFRPLSGSGSFGLDRVVLVP